METKKWYLSKTVWASFLIVIVSVLRLWGRPEAEVIEQEAEGIAAWIGEAVTIVLAAIAFISRLSAKTELTK